MSAYLIGNVLGRLALSYAIIWLAIWLGLAKLSWRDACRRTNHWIGLTAITTVFLVGLAQSNAVAS